MDKKVKIIDFQLASGDTIKATEVELTKLVNDGWKIVGSGGAGAGPGRNVSDRLGDNGLVFWGFVVLQHD